ncbi:MAG TPA: DNA repair protein RecO, partial [bacterium]|nr:DNA repair protein RecO [bacterium]
MPVYTAEGIVIRRANLGEADRVVTFYTRDHGKLAAAARGARRPGSRFAGRLELFTQLRLLLARGRTLDIVSQAEVIEPFAAVRNDLGRLGAASLVAEVADRATAERDPQPALYRTLRAALAVIAAEDAALAALWFVARALVLTGYAPLVDRCAVCGRAIGPGAAFSSVLGGALCAAHRARDPDAAAASVAALAALGFLRDASPAALRRLALTPAHR